MKNIGGFFELEIANGNSLYHDNAIKLSTGRACLNYVLNSKIPNKVYLPFYCCDALIEPLFLNNISYEFYQIDENLEIKTPPQVDENDLIIVCDFFGVKSNYINSLIEVYDNQLIIDNTHSFFIKEYSSETISFTTARKYFGVPDGAFLYIPEKYKLLKEIKRNQQISLNHNINRLLGNQTKSYQEFVEYEKSLNSSISKISLISEKILKTINYTEIREIRNSNFNFFEREFNSINTLTLDKNLSDCFCYPLLLERPIDFKKLYSKNIFTPNYWLDVVNREQNLKYTFEKKLSLELLPLPIDHRYTTNDLQRVCNTIKRIINE